MAKPKAKVVDFMVSCCGNCACWVRQGNESSGDCSLNPPTVYGQEFNQENGVILLQGRPNMEDDEHCFQHRYLKN